MNGFDEIGCTQMLIAEGNRQIAQALVAWCSERFERLRGFLANTTARSAR